MKKLLLILALLLVPSITFAQFTTVQGGTGTSSPSGILFGNGTLHLKTTSIGTGLIITGTTLSSTGLSADPNWNFVQASPTNYLIPTTTTTGLIVMASSTIGDGTQGGGLMISGGATTTKSVTIGSVGFNTNLTSPSLAVQGGASFGANSWMTALNSGIWLNSVGTFNVGIQRVTANAATNAMQFVPSNTIQAEGKTWFVANGNWGFGTSSPTAKLSIMANSNDTTLNTILFSIGSSTALATTTSFSVDNTGFTNIGGQANTSISGDGRVLQAEGGDTFFGNESNIGTTIGVRRNNAFLGGFSTANSNFNINGNGAGLSATGNNGLVIANTGTVPFSIGSSTPSNVYAKFSITTQTSDQTLSTAFLIASSSVANGTTTPFAIANTGWIVTSGPLPTATSCGTTNNISGNQTNGTVMFTGTLVTSCTVNFPNSVPVGTTLQCTESDNSLAATADISATTTNSVTFGLSTGLASGAITWNCEASRNANN